MKMFGQIVNILYNLPPVSTNRSIGKSFNQLSQVSLTTTAAKPAKPTTTAAKPAKRSSKREFTAAVKRAERVKANNSCRICGINGREVQLEFAHIHSLSLNNSWRRIGTRDENWRNDNYVKSEANCILLCPTHHSMIDMPDGLQKYSVDYLESLKTNVTDCTSLIKTKSNSWHRCSNANQRGKQSNNYFCQRHNGSTQSNIQNDANNECLIM